MWPNYLNKVEQHVGESGDDPLFGFRGSSQVERKAGARIEAPQAGRDGDVGGGVKK